MAKRYSKIVLSFLACFLIVQTSFAVITFTAKASTAWGVSTTWTTTPNTPGAVPTASDIVSIPGAFNVSLDATGDVCSSLSVAGTLTGATFTLTVGSGGFTNSGTTSFTTGTLNDAGSFASSGTFTYGTGTVNMNGAAAQSLGGTTAPTFYNLIINNSTSSTVTLTSNITVNNILTLTKGTLDVSPSNYILTIVNTLTNNASTTAFNGETGTVTFSNTSTINGTSGTTFYNLTLASGAAAITLTATTQPITVTNTLNISPGTAAPTMLLNANTLTVGGNVIIGNNGAVKGVLTFTTGALNIGANFTDNGTFNYGTGTVTFNGVSGQTMTAASSPLNFYNLISNPNSGVIVSMGVAIKINNNFSITQGTFYSSSFAITGNGSGTMTMSSNTTLLLGSTTVATAVAFPSGYGVASINLATNSTVTYQANTNQIISGTPNYGNLTVTGGTVSTTNTLSSACPVFGDFVIQNGTGVVTFDQSGFTMGLHGNFTDNGVYLADASRDSLSGKSGVQALSSTEAGGLTFYDLYVNNSSATAPGITTTSNITVTDKIKYLAGQLDLKGHTFTLEGSSPSNTIASPSNTIITDLFSGGSIISSVAGANFNVTDGINPADTCINLEFQGVDSVHRFIIGGSGQGITQSVYAYNISFQYFTEYGTALFEQIGNNGNSFGGGNGFHGPVTFTAYKASELWKFATFASQQGPLEADTFYTCTVNANANGVGSGNNNFILGSNNLSTFNGTTTFTSNTAGGFYIGRDNGTGASYTIFNGPLICNINNNGFMEFGNSTGGGDQKTVVFNNTIQLNSNAASLGHYYFGNSSASTIIISSTGQFIGTGTVQGQTDVFLENVTQSGTLTQTINTAGSTGLLEIGGGTTTGSAKRCVFNGPCVFTADTAGYIINAKFYNTASLTFTVNHAGANGYILSDTCYGNVTATVGEMRVQNNVFGTSPVGSAANTGITVSLTETNTITADSSVNNGGNKFYVPVTINNTGNAFMFWGGPAADYFYSDVTFLLNGPCIMSAGSKVKSYFGGNITVGGNQTYSMYFGYYHGATSGGMIISGTGTQVFSVTGSAVEPYINNLNMNMTGTGTNILEISNFNVDYLAGTLTFSPNTALNNTGLINLNGHTMTLGYLLPPAFTLDPLSYPTPSSASTPGWIYGGTFTRDFKTVTVPLPTAAATSTTGFFPMGSSPVLNVFQPLWFATTNAIGTAGSVSVSQTSNTSGYSSIAPYNDATWAGGTSVQGVSNATWVVSEGNGLALGAGTAYLVFGGFGFNTFLDADVNASLAASTIDTYVAPLNLWSAATDVEVERSGLSLAQLNNTWHIGTSNTHASPLPIQLTSFTADCANYAALLKWTTATETNNDFFTLEKTQDGNYFEKVAVLPGAGTSTAPRDYLFTDKSPFTTTSYYRLSQTDLDGKTTALNTIVYVPCENQNAVTSFAYNKSIKIEINSTTEEAYTIILYNSLGQMVYNKSVSTYQGLNSYNITPNTGNGVYILRVTGTSTVYSKKLVLAPQN